MDEKRPKRRKDKDNPYTLSKRQDKHYLSFRDGQGVLRELLINKELFELLDCFELDDLSFLNEMDRHYEHSELTEATLYDRAFVLPESVEDAVLRNMRYEALHNAINKLPETQRRRLYCIISMDLHTPKLQKWRDANIRRCRIRFMPL